MKRWKFKVFLIIPVLIVILECGGVYTLQSVYAQGSPQLSTQTSIQSSQLGSNQSGDLQQIWSGALIAFIAVLISTNVTLAIALGSSFKWVFLQYKDHFENYKKEVEDLHKTAIKQALKEQEITFKNQLNQKEVDNQKNIKDLEINLEDLQRKNRHLNQTDKFKVEEYFLNLDKLLEEIRNRLLKERERQFQQYKLRARKVTELTKKNSNLKEVLDKSSIEQLKELNYDKEKAKKDLGNIRRLLEIIPEIQVIYKEIIRELLVRAIIPIPPYEKKIDTDSILMLLKKGCQELEKYKQVYEVSANKYYLEQISQMEGE